MRDDITTLLIHYSHGIRVDFSLLRVVARQITYVNLPI